MMPPMGLYARAMRLSMTLALTLACAALALFWPGWLTTLRAQTYGYPISLSIVSGNGGAGATGQQLAPFVVQTSPPTSGVTVVWSVNAGGGSLASGATVTGANGRTSNVLTVGSTSTIIVNATAIESNTVTFTAACTTCTGNGHQVAGAEAALEGLRQASTLIPVGLLSARTQLHNIGLRLQSLRRGGATLSAGGLSMTIDGEPSPPGVAASHLFSLSRGTGASADGSPLGNLGVFANGLGTFGDQRSRRNEPGFDFHTAGVTAGADYRVLPQLVLGLALGYGSSRNDFDGGAGDVTSKGISVSAYGGYTLGGFHADAIFTYGWSDYDTERRIASVVGPVTAKGSPGGDQLAVGANVGYDFSFGALTIGPTLRLTYVDVSVDGFTERGGGAFNMRLRRQNAESLTTSMGGEVSYAIGVPFGVLTPLLRFEWEHEYLAGSRLVTGTLATDPTGTVFGIRTSDPDRDYFNLGIGLTGTFRSGVSAFFYYEALLGRDRVTNHSFTAGVRFEF